MSDKINGLSEKQFLGLLSSRLKEVLNPTIYNINEGSDEYSEYFILQTDITDTTKQIGFFLEGTGEESVIKFAGHFSDDTSIEQQYYGLNNGTCLVNGFGFKFIDDKLCIIVNIQLVNTLSAEVFLFDGTDNKNHCTEITKGFNIDESSWHIQPFSGDSEVNFSFDIVDKNGNTTTINQYSQRDETVITSVSEAGTANKLSSNIPITVTSQNNTVSGSGTINTSSSTPTATLQLQASVSIPDVPVATTSRIGGIKLATAQDMPNDKCFPVKLTSSLQSQNKAYVDLSSLQIETQNTDKHRYTDMSEATRECSVGDIVEYIGESADGFIKGYFYMLVNQALIGSLPIPCNWYGITPDYKTVLNTGLSNLYEESGYLLSLENGLNITPIDESDVSSDSSDDELTFNVSSGPYQIQMTYDEIKSTFGIQLYESAQDFDLNISIEPDTTSSTWVQKDVQPTVKLKSGLRYRGILEHYSDLQNLQNPEDGDFYTITELDNAEYFLDINEWKLLGPEMSHAYRSGQNISINDSTYEISALGYTYYKDSTKAFESGNNTQASGNYSHTEGYKSEASGYGAHAEGGAIYMDNSSERDFKGGFASGAGSHAEGNLTKATGVASHAEGSGWEDSQSNSIGYIIASGPGSHAEGLSTNSDATIQASGAGSHAEGYVQDSRDTVASGKGSHAEGCGTTASGDFSHAEGEQTIAQNYYEHAQGCLNKSHRETTTSGGSTIEVSEHCTRHSIGIGTSNTRENAIEVMGNGDVYIIGVGNYDGQNIKPTAGVQTLQEVLADIPSQQVQSDWNQSTATASDYIKNKPTLATVATSGSYNDLTDKPELPSAQVQSNWSQSNPSAVDFIRNKPNFHIILNSTFSYNASTSTWTITGIDDLSENGIYLCNMQNGLSGFILEHYPSYRQVVTLPGGWAMEYGVPNGYNLYRDWNYNSSSWGDWILQELDYATNINIGMVKLGYKGNINRSYPLSIENGTHRAYTTVPWENWENHSFQSNINSIEEKEPLESRNYNYQEEYETTITISGTAGDNAYTCQYEGSDVEKLLHLIGNCIGISGDRKSIVTNVDIDGDDPIIYTSVSLDSENDIISENIIYVAETALLEYQDDNKFKLSLNYDHGNLDANIFVSSAEQNIKLGLANGEEYDVKNISIENREIYVYIDLFIQDPVNVLYFKYTPNRAIGNYSHAEGRNIAIGDYSHAEGNGQSDFTESQSVTDSLILSGAADSLSYTISNAQNLPSINQLVRYKDIIARIISISNNTITFDKTLDETESLVNYPVFVLHGVAYGNCSHSEGGNVMELTGDLYVIPGGTAIGNGSHAEGIETQSIGTASHAEGYKCTAKNDYEHACGTHNVSHLNQTIFSVGIGSRTTNFKNAFEITNNGDVYLYGAGNYDGTETKQQDSSVKTLQELLATDNEIHVGGSSVNYNSGKYIKKVITSGQTFALTIDVSGQINNQSIVDDGVKEVIYRIDNTSGNDVSISVTGGVNMWNPDIRTGISLADGETMEIVITFWSPDDATFNGGISSD